VIDAGRLRRGRAYARAGQVLAINEVAGGIQAKVQGSRSTPYRVSIQLQPLSDAQWNAVIAALAERAIFTAQLLAGEMPTAIEEAFAAAGVSLFPEQRAALTVACTCPDPASPCKHVAATHYILGEQFDEDPFLLFRLRGRSQEQIIAALRALRTVAGETALAESPEPYVAAVAEPPLATLLDQFWTVAQPLGQLATTVKPPLTPRPILRRLGQPAFLDENLETLLGPAYDRIMATALETASTDEQA